MHEGFFGTGLRIREKPSGFQGIWWQYLALCKIRSRRTKDKEPIEVSAAAIGICNNLKVVSPHGLRSVQRLRRASAKQRGAYRETRIMHQKWTIQKTYKWQELGCDFSSCEDYRIARYNYEIWKKCWKLAFDRATITYPYNVFIISVKSEWVKK